MRRSAGLNHRFVVFGQAQLAQQLDITDRAVSKWETGRCLSDAAAMPALCALLHISVDELLRGEVPSAQQDRETTQQALLELIAQKQAADRRLLRLEVVVVIVSATFLFTLIALGKLLMKVWLF